MAIYPKFFGPYENNSVKTKKSNNLPTVGLTDRRRISWQNWQLTKKKSGSWNRLVTSLMVSNALSRLNWHSAVSAHRKSANNSKRLQIDGTRVENIVALLNADVISGSIHLLDLEAEINLRLFWTLEKMHITFEWYVLDGKYFINTKGEKDWNV